MKLLFYASLIVLAFFLGSCKSGQTQQNLPITSQTGGIVATTKQATTAAELEAIVSFLASDQLGGRDTGTEGIETAAQFIEKTFKNLGISPYYETYRDTFEVSGEKGFNIVAFAEGNDSRLKDEFIIIGAHYDHIGKGNPVGGDEIANGANDNAAGTAAVLEFAKYFSQTNSNKRSVLFILFSAEEMGLIGSNHIANRLKEDGINLYAMLNFEMIGVPMQNKAFKTYLTGYETSNMGAIINEFAQDTLVGLLPKAKEFNLFRRSDNYPFYKAFKVPSQTISTFDFENYDYYHHVDDEASKLNYNHMAEIVNAYKIVLNKIANSETQRIKNNE